MSGFLEIALIVTIAVILLGIMLNAGLMRYARRHIPDWPGTTSECSLTAVIYSAYGGTPGGHYTVEMNADSDSSRSTTVTISEQSAHDAPESRKTETVSPDCCSELAEIIDRYGMTGWADLPQSDPVAYDTAACSVSIRYSDGSVYGISAQQALPDTWGDAFAEIRSCMLSYAGALTETAD